MKKYLDKDGNIWDGVFIYLNDMQIWNPTEEQLIEAGYTEYIESQEEHNDDYDEDSVEKARAAKIAEIEAFDRSSSVNSFTINGQEMWLTVEERQQLATQISANEAFGRDEMTRWFNGEEYTFPIKAWKEMLTALEVYAGDAINATEINKSIVKHIANVQGIKEYNYAGNYPEKLIFNI